ncbi:ATP-binding protein [Planktomarina sp.]|uniref:ATP-binding protein n=1 Tax=Planktomarina sp. TaxID=2024851 RepID=UPI0032617885
MADIGERLGGDNIEFTVDKPLRIIIGGPPHSGKSTFMNLLEDRFRYYQIPVELLDLDLSAPTPLKTGFTQQRDKKKWTSTLAEEAKSMFEQAEGVQVVLGDSVGLISDINEIISQPADVAILLVSGGHGDYDTTYRKVVRKWKEYYEDIRTPLLVVLRSTMNPRDESMFDPQDNYGVVVGLDRDAYEANVISGHYRYDGLYPTNACLEGVVFEIAQSFDLKVRSATDPEHLNLLNQKWPDLKDKKTWTPPEGSMLGGIERAYFEERGRVPADQRAESFGAETITTTKIDNNGGEWTLQYRQPPIGEQPTEIVATTPTWSHEKNDFSNVFTLYLKRVPDSTSIMPSRQSPTGYWWTASSKGWGEKNIRFTNYDSLWNWIGSDEIYDFPYFAESFGAESFEDFKIIMIGDGWIAGDMGYMEGLEEYYNEYLDDFTGDNPESFEDFQERILREDYTDEDFKRIIFGADSTPRFIPVEVIKYADWWTRRYGREYNPRDVNDYDYSYVVCVRDIPIAHFDTKEKAENHARTARTAINVLGGMNDSTIDHPLALKEMDGYADKNIRGGMNMAETFDAEEDEWVGGDNGEQIYWSHPSGYQVIQNKIGGLILIVNEKGGYQGGNYSNIDDAIRNAERMISKGAETFGAEADLSFKEWADQETMTHGQQEPFDDWLNDELSSHGDNVSLHDWGQHELDSHYERYGAENMTRFEIVPSVEVEGIGIVSGALVRKYSYLTGGRIDNYDIYDDDAAEEVMSIPANDPRFPLQEGELELIEAMVYGFNHPRINDSWGELNEDGMFWASKVMDTLSNYQPYAAEEKIHSQLMIGSLIGLGAGLWAVNRFKESREER